MYIIIIINTCIIIIIIIIIVIIIGIYSIIDNDNRTFIDNGVIGLNTMIGQLNCNDRSAYWLLIES